MKFDSNRYYDQIFIARWFTVLLRPRPQLQGFSDKGPLWGKMADFALGKWG